MKLIAYITKKGAYPSLRAERSNPEILTNILDCHVALLLAMTLFILMLASNAAMARSTLNLSTLLQKISSVKAKKVYYQEIRKFNFMKKSLHSKGIFYFKYPNYFEQRMLSPRKQRLIAKGTQLTIIIPGQKTRRIALRQYPNVWALIATLRALLSNQPQFFKRYYFYQIHGNPKNWRLTLKLKQRISNTFKQININGNNNRIKQLTMIYNNNGYIKTYLRY